MGGFRLWEFSVSGVKWHSVRVPLYLVWIRLFDQQKFECLGSKNIPAYSKETCKWVEE